MKTNFRKVYVEWVDSARSYDWERLDEFEGEPVECESIGWLIKETDKYVIIAQNLGYEPVQVCNTMTIPKCAVTKMVDMIRECDLTD